MKFGLQVEQDRSGNSGRVLRALLAGPVIVMRNAIRGAILEQRAPHWLALSTVISTVWSFFSGVVMLELLFRLNGI